MERYGEENYVNIEKQKQTCLEKYGKESYIQTGECQNKIYQTKKKNHTFNSSKIEKEFANYLKENNFKFERQYRSELYPFNCDFYLSDFDLYIEIQGTWCHGYHPFDKDNENDKNILSDWIEKSIEHPYYENAIDVWTKRDVKKREIAKENKLNYLEIFSNSLKQCINSLQQFIKNKGEDI